MEEKLINVAPQKSLSLVISVPYNTTQGGGGTWKIDLQLPFPPNIVPEFHFFFLNVFFCHISFNSFFGFVYWYLLSLRDPHRAQKCSVHESSLGGTYVEIYQERRVLWYSMFPLISLSVTVLELVLVRIWSRYILAQSHTHRFLNAADVDGELCTTTGTLKCPPPSTLSATHPITFGPYFLGIHKVKTFENSTSFFSTTSRHPLDTTLCICKHLHLG